MQLELQNMTTLKPLTYIFRHSTHCDTFQLFKVNFTEPEQTIVESNQG